MPKHYTDKAVADWTTNDFLAYLADRHLAVYGTEYTPPGRNWQVERGLLGTLIGTRGKGKNASSAKPRKYEPELVKAFIDECFRSHKCSPQWPTVSFTWLWKWKTDIWARMVAEHGRKQAAEARAEGGAGETAQVDENLIDWL